MKKLKLSELNLSGAEVLTRDQLKNVLGGGTNMITTGGGNCGTVNNCSSGPCTFKDGGSGTCGLYGGNTPTETCGCIGAE